MMACLVGARGPNTTTLSVEEIQALLKAMETHQNLNGLQRLKGEFAKNNQLQETGQTGRLQNQLCKEQNAAIEEQLHENKEKQNALLKPLIGENALFAPMSFSGIAEQERLKQEETILKQRQESLKQYENKKPITSADIADDLGAGRVFQTNQFQTTPDEEKAK